MRTLYKVLLGAIPLLAAFLPAVRTQAQTYCTPTYSNGCTFQDDINTFTLTGASGTSYNQVNTGCSAGGYANYTTLPAVNLVPGNAYTGTINSNYSCCEYVRIWIDFNNDGVFDSSATSIESVDTIENIATALVPVNLSIPLTVTPGLRRMRVRMVFAPSGGAITINPCASATYGETHDYTVNIVALTQCAGVPSPAGSSSTSNSAPCAGTPITISLPNGPVAGGLSYSLESSTTSATTGFGAPIATSLTPFFSVTPSVGTTWYRIVTTCTNTGGGAAQSTAVQVVVPTLFPGGVYSINNSVATGGTNFNTFNDAVAAVSCGISGPVVFNVANNAAVYNEQITIPNIPTTSSANTITFNGNGATISNNTASTLPGVISLNGADFIRIKRLNIRGLNAAASMGVVITNDANNNLIDSCTIALDSNSTSFGPTALAITGSLTSSAATGSNSCDSNTISNNTLIGGYYCMTLYGSSSVGAYNTGNVISNNVLRNFYLYGMYGAYMQNSIIERNDMSRPSRTNLSTFYGVYFFSGNGGVNIRRNVIHDPSPNLPSSSYTAYGIYTSGLGGTVANPCEVSNNLIHSMRFNGAMYALYNSSSTYTRYYHNTVSVDDPLATNTGVTRGIYHLGTSPGVEYKNNIISLNRGGTGVKHGMYSGSTLNTTNTYSARSNVYYVPNAGTTGGVAYYNAVNYPTLAAYQAVSMQDTGSVEGNPVFAAPAGSAIVSYTPTNASINNIGVPTPVAIDITGASRNATTPDPGAIEFTPAPCTTPPTAGIATSSDTVVCSGTIVSFDLNGNSFGLGQTYQWQAASALAGPYTNVGTSSSQTNYSQAVATTTYFRAAVTCGASTTFSDTQLVTVLAPLAGGTYTINAAAPASATNFQSFATAVQALQCGISGPVVMNVLPAAGSGTYNEQLYLPSTISGTSATNTITFNGNGNILNFTATNSNRRGAVMLDGADWVRVNNLVINVNTTASTYGFGIHLINDADNNIIQNCTVNIDSTATSSLFAGVVVNGSYTGATSTGIGFCDSNQLLNNVVKGGYYGMTCVGNSTTAPNYNNLFRGNTVSNFYLYGIYGYYTNGWVIDSNYITRPSRPLISTFYGVGLSTMAINSTISRNRIFNTAGASTTSYTAYPLYVTGADATAAQPNMWVNNMVYNINGNASIYGIYNSSSDFNIYRHNTISLDDTTYTGASLTYGAYQTTLATGLDYRNNIISIRRTSSGNRTALYFNTATTTFTSNYNDLYVAGGTTGTNNIGYLSSAYSTLSAWQSGTGKDTASVDIDPMFAGGAAGGNLTPTNVAVDNLGQPAGVTQDAFGAPRSLTVPDLGAIEWSFIPPCAAPTALVDVAAATSATISWTSSISTNVGYEYVIGTSSATPTGPGLNAPTAPLTEYGLTSGTTYYWFVRTVCGPTSYSPWVGDSFTTCVPPAATLMAMGSTTPTTAVAICQGDTAVLRAAGGTGNTYLFLLNGTVVGTGAGSDSVLRTQQPGTYRVVVTNATGCFDTSAAAGITVTVNPLPTPLITQVGFNQLTTGTFTSYQWNLAGQPVGGATLQTFTTSTNGSYTVTVTDANGCRATSNAYSLTTASVGGAAGAAATVRVFPNPTSGRIFIESTTPVTAQLWTIDGRKLMEVQKAKSLDLRSFAAGIYVLRVMNAEGTMLLTERVTKAD